ncbi:ferredoxin-nitrite reductase [Methylobacterium sp. PvP062]|jgi:ferredoxin-nitrite reductase|uniref:Precorrin-3B synthase n=2 Tax=Methylobacterium radiotolerans TaxID=31998 RepID=B1LXT7_METRJ|nr:MULTISPECIES: NirA family protein [Methylobacterium]MCX7331272.1 NirA family protein [Hyphomicrobiales bacterium]GAN49547.1 ferredoxin-nitrite reductase [Methylobacterium sp. ME121]ACB24294.1 precorrin-3B synthase [Methylobacterium radiotolerans JCM 2831]KIU34055.1 ferredoxin--nitrite reductase [Methylobacterium radiotolerans]KTS12705.1 ferredoxin--nitrite reductase [Methylobacterium radiotolerans]
MSETTTQSAAGAFEAEQKRYLEGFASGIAAVRLTGGLAPGGAGAAAPPAEPTGPDAIHIKAQDRTVRDGGKLCDQEKWKRAENPFDGHNRLIREAAAGKQPKPEDNFRWRYHGMFWVAPNQVSYMCRLRIPNGILHHWQFAGVADLADQHGGGYVHVTTRANLQVREIDPEHAQPFLDGLTDIGLTARGAGADNIRNVTGSSTAGIDAQELLDTRPLAKSWHNWILNDRSLYGLPRKFNVAFDGSGVMPTLEETNDIGFQAVEVLDGAAVPPGIYMRLVLGGISGHRDLARDTGIVLKPEDCNAVADAIIRVFIENGDRTNRNKSRMKYVLDAWGFDKYLAAVEDKLGRKLDRVAPEHVAPRKPTDRFAHVGVHAQKQPGLNWIGVVLPVGKMTSDQVRALAKVAAECGDGQIRLTVWQNFIVSGVPDAKVAEVEARVEALGLTTKAAGIRSGLVACTGARGCKFAASDTKGHALIIADHVEKAVPNLDVPVNVHLTGCHHSCAQHYIGDIGLIGAKVVVSEEGDTVEGYDVVVGGGFAENPKIGTEIWKAVKAEDAPARVEALLRAYLALRQGPEESFQAFTSRTGAEALRDAAEDQPALKAAA